MELGEWEQRHERTFGEGPWPRTERMVWALTKRMIGWDPRDMDRLEQEGEDPAAREERQRTWLPASRLLALALWREAFTCGVLVDDVPLLHGLGWLHGDEHAGLWAAPLPSWKPAPMPGRSWDRLQRREHELLQTAHSIVLWHEGRPSRRTSCWPTPTTERRSRRCCWATGTGR